MDRGMPGCSADVVSADEDSSAEESVVESLVESVVERRDEIGDAIGNNYMELEESGLFFR